MDELNAVLGLVTAYCPDCPEAALLRGIQNDLFDVGADLCVPPAEGEEPGKSLRVTAAQAERLEKAIDRLNENLRTAQELRSARWNAGRGVAAPRANRVPPRRTRGGHADAHRKGELGRC